MLHPTIRNRYPLMCFKTTISCWELLNCRNYGNKITKHQQLPLTTVTGIVHLIIVTDSEYNCICTNHTIPGVTFFQTVHRLSDFHKDSDPVCKHCLQLTAYLSDKHRHNEIICSILKLIQESPTFLFWVYQVMVQWLGRGWRNNNDINTVIWPSRPNTTSPRFH